jgi:hypothetical protein
LNRIKELTTSTDFIFLLVLSVGGLIYLSFFYNYGINLLDEGYLLNSAKRVVSGEIPYKDFYTPYPPGRYYLLAFLFKTFGQNANILRILEAMILVSCSILVYIIARILGVNQVFSLIAAILMILGPGPWHKIFYPFFTLVNILVILLFQKKATIYRCLLISGVIGLTFLFRQDIGIISLSIFLFMILLMVLTRKKDFYTLCIYSTSSLVIPFLIILIPYAMILTKIGLSTLTYHLFNAGFREVTSTSLPFGTISPLFKGYFFANFLKFLLKSIFFIPILIYILSIIHAITFFFTGEERAPIILVTAFGLFSSHQILWRSDLGHLLQSSSPAYILIGLLLESIFINIGLVGINEKIKILMSSAIIIVLMLFMITLIIAGGSSYPGTIFTRFGNKRSLDIENCHFFIKPELADALEKTVNLIHSKTMRDEKILAIPDIPIIYFLSDRKNPARHDLYLPGRLQGEGEEIQIIENFKKNPPKIIIYNINNNNDGFPERKFDQQFYIFQKFIESNYKTIDKFGGFAIYELDIEP